MIHPSHSTWFYHLNNILWSVQVMKLLIVQSSPASSLILSILREAVQTLKILIFENGRCMLSNFWLALATLKVCSDLHSKFRTRVQLSRVSAVSRNVQTFENCRRKSNCTHEEVNSRLNSGNVCHHSVWKLAWPSL